MSVGTKNHYELLGVERDVSAQVIRDTYKELARIYHPDSHYFDDLLAEAGMDCTAPASSSPSPGAEETFKLITEAYNTLSSINRRAEYDALLPRATPGWEADLKREFELDQREHKFQNPDVAQPYCWGGFGELADEGPQGAVSVGNVEVRPVVPGEDLAHRSVSDIIREQNSLSARIRRIFGI